MQPYQQAILQALSIPRYISQSDSVSQETTYPNVSAQLLDDLSSAFNQDFTIQPVVFGEHLVVTAEQITLPYPLTGTTKKNLYQNLTAHFTNHK